MLQVKMCACVYICVHTVEMGVGEPLTTTGEESQCRNSIRIVQ